MSMTKREMAVAIAEKTGLTQVLVAEVLQETINTIAAELATGRNVELRNFGIFELRVRKGRIGRNPNKPSKNIVIPECLVVKFRSGKALRDKLQKIDLKKFKSK